MDSQTSDFLVVLIFDLLKHAWTIPAFSSSSYCLIIVNVCFEFLITYSFYRYTYSSVYFEFISFNFLSAYVVDNTLFIEYSFFVKAVLCYLYVYEALDCCTCCFYQLKSKLYLNFLCEFRSTTRTTYISIKLIQIQMQ